jgi:biopolymer transport protein TolR
MAGFIDQNEDEPIAQINIIPFVDISLVLLIIFMLTANIIARASIPVDLPHAASANESVDSTVNIVVTATGELFLDGNAVDEIALRGQIEQRVHASPRVRAVIAADKAVRYERVVWVIDQLKQAGVDAFALNVERKER